MNYRRAILLILIIIIASCLRLFKLSEDPPSLYWDETSLGYNAYSILKTGKDEHGEFLPLARFIAFGDFKPPGYIYATVPAITVFGLNEFAVRFPSALSGIILTFISYFLAKEIFKNEKVALTSSFLVALSPWSTNFSRGAFEANLAATFNALAILSFLKFKKGKGQLLLISLIFFILAFYTFNANRIISPLLFGALLVLKIKELLTEKIWVIISFLIGLILLFPSYSYLNSYESRVRFQEVSIFNNLEILKKSNERIALHQNSLFGRILHNRRIAYTLEFLGHYFDHLKGDFLFISGDRNPRLSSQDIGELYLFSLPFLIVGLFFAIRMKGKDLLPLFPWFLISLIPASVARETPHALRSASILPIYDLLTAYGICYIYKKTKFLNKIIFTIFLSVILIFSLYYHLHHYYIHYPRDFSGEWQYGYKQVVLKVKSLEDQYDYIVVTEGLGRPYIYFLFYNKVNPEFYWQTRIADRDWFGFWTVSGFGKYRFGLEKLADFKGRVLVVGTDGETKNMQNILETIYSPKGEVVFRIGTM